jgi:putative phosphoesterase
MTTDRGTSGNAGPGVVTLRDNRRMRLVLTADTHLPKRARRLPALLWEAIDAADVVVHAGDWVSVTLLDELTARSRRLVGVYGNNDGADLRARLPEVAREEVAGLRMAVIHETGAKLGREERCAALFPDCDLLVFGHSHIPWDTTAPGGLRLLNPADIAAGALTDVVLHPVPPR